MEKQVYYLEDGDKYSFDLKTASDIKYFYETRNPEGHFFDRETMRFFEDTMSNFGVAWDNEGYRILTRKKPVKHGLQGAWRVELDGDLSKI